MSESTLSRRDFLRLSSATALTTTLTGCVGYPPMAESNPDLPGAAARNIGSIKKTQSWGMGDLAENAMRQCFPDCAAIKEIPGIVCCRGKRSAQDRRGAL